MTYQDGASEADIMNRFHYHSPGEFGLRRMKDIRQQAELFANMIRIEVPPGREQALALTNLEQATFWANAGIAREPSLQGGTAQ